MLNLYFTTKYGFYCREHIKTNLMHVIYFSLQSYTNCPDQKWKLCSYNNETCISWMWTVACVKCFLLQKLVRI